jgi:hypothetical protein
MEGGFKLNLYTHNVESLFSCNLIKFQLEGFPEYTFCANKQHILYIFVCFVLSQTLECGNTHCHICIRSFTR